MVNKRHSRTIGPLQATRSDFQERTRGANPAAELIRRKINELYAKEPSAQQEQANTLANNGPAQYSKHQRFMYELSTSGKPLAQIQTEWHNYYINLSDNEKHEVWQEFYETNARQPSAYTQFVRSQAAQQPATTPPPHIPHKDRFAILRAPVFVSDHAPVQQATGQTAAGIKRQMLEEIKTYNRTQLKLHHHIQSLAFGLGLGVLVLFIFLFGFFNQIIIAPLIQPASTQSNTPIILSTSGVAPSSNPEVIIPKINVEIPVIYDETSVNDAAVETSLQDGVLHYPTTVFPGQLGNAAFFGHSSNNILNPGKYKFAFVLLHTLVPGDVFYLTYNDKVYAYQVYDRQIVNPGDVSVLNNVPGKIATATLITCDPPGTSINRLVVWGEQISPDPSTNASPAQTITPAEQPGQLANDGPSLWGRFTHWLTNLL
ncbi:MAG TPA: sortase [Candidatus Saccharimonadales bacterium]|nr:sortase [Candidatus Saccharimonadales bacterium]